MIYRMVDASEPSWTSVALEEYRSLRQESLQAIDRQHQILALGTATSGVLLGIGAKAKPRSTIAVTLLMVLMPVLASLVVALWIGEFERMVRAGAHVAQLEWRINGRFNDESGPPLTWESRLRRGPARPRVRWLYPAIMGVLIGLGAAAAALGFAGLLDARRVGWAVPLGLVDLALLGWTFRFYVGSELRLRALGGEPLHEKPVARLARWLRCDKPAVELARHVAQAGRALCRRPA